MTTELHYPKAPITEALIDIQVATNVSIDELRKVCAGEEAAYPHVEPLTTNTTAIMVGPDGNAITTTSQPIGYLCRSADNLQSYQARINGFTFSRLAPYPHWRAFSGETRRLWDNYRVATNSQTITRLAVRYVNRIDIPLPLANFGDYLRTLPQLSPELPQGLSGYFMQLMFPLTDSKCDGIINQALIAPARADVVSVVLDIDIFRTTDLPTNEDELWESCEHLRTAKNFVFEACITDDARGLFR